MSEARTERLRRFAGVYAQEPGGLRRVRFVDGAIEQHFSGAPSGGARAVDVGCGQGHLTVALANMGMDALGVDLDGGTIEVARRDHATERVRFETIDVASLPNDTFDVVLCSEVLEHLDEPRRMVVELARIAKPGALLIVTVPNGWCLEEILRRGAVKTRPGRWFRRRLKPTLSRSGHVQSSNMECPHVQFFSQGAIRNLLESNGLLITAQAGAGYFFREAYYLGLRFMISRSGRAFAACDRADDWIADRVPPSLASGWLFALEKA